MTLEDHLGDVLRKARTAAGVAMEAAAAAAGLSAAQLQNLEQTGQGPAANWQALAACVGLDGPKLARLAGGWLPAERDLGQWRELRILATTQEGNTVNCYLAWDEVSRAAALFDTGWDAAPVVDMVRRERLDLQHLFITHAHQDHVAALGALREQFPKIRLHRSAAEAPPQERNRANDFIHLGSLRITNRATPGHAPDGMTYVIGTWPEDAPAVAIVGDTLFAGSLATGFVSADQLKRSVREQIFTLPPETLLCPGHGPVTTVMEERANNPFFAA
jgi:hydroxyacylglutathione hydrolase